MPKATKTPKPPDDLSDEGLLEWQRIVGELRAIGRLEKADRAIMTLYCRTWQINCLAFRYVEQLGPVVSFSNNNPGMSPFYRTWQQTTALCDRLLASMCLTPATRKVAPQTQETSDLEF